MTQLNARSEGLRDAAAWLHVNRNNNQDTEGRHAIAMHCDPTELVDALTDTLLWVIHKQNIDIEYLLDVMRSAADLGESDEAA